jgi:hypothetical protein
MPILFSNPCICIGMLEQRSHDTAAKAKGRLKAHFFEGVKHIKVLRRVGAIQHSSTLRQAESKRPSSEEDGLLPHIP